MKKYIGFIIAVLLFFVQLTLLPHTGMTWDEPSSFFFGRANLKFWLTGNRQYLTDLRSIKLFADSPFRYIYGEDLYPPFPFVVASGFSYILAEHLHLLSVIDAHHLGEVFLGAIGIWAFYGIATEIGTSTFVASFTTIMFALYPTIFGQMRSDAKDIPLMSVLTVFVYFAIKFVKSFRQKSFPLHVRWALLAGVVFGLAFASKPTAPVILVPLLAWFVISLSVHGSFRREVGSIGRLIPLIFVSGITGLAFFIFAWPWLWNDPVGYLIQVWQFFRVVGLAMPVQYFGKTLQAGISLPKEYAFVILLIQTPIEITLLAIAGALYSFYLFIKKRNSFAILPIFWFSFGMARYLLPGVIIYARVRHFIDAIPGFFLLVGFGLMAIQWSISVVFKRQSGIFTAIIFLAILGHILWIDATYYPYEPSYYNALVGGTAHVAKSNLFDVEYWGSTIAEGMRWVKFQPGNKVVYACGLKHIAIFYTDSTVQISSTPDMGDYAFVPTAYSWFGGPKNIYREGNPPVYTVSRAGADMMDIFKITNRTWWCGYETDMDLPADRIWKNQW